MKTFAIGWHGCGTLFDFEAKERELGDLEQQMASASFWDDKEKSQATVQQLKAVKEIVDPLRQFQQSFEDVEVLAELADEESDEETAAEAQKEARGLASKLGQFEFRAMLDGPEDRRNAYLSIHAGAGGTESCDWAAMLFRMYTRWAGASDYECETIEDLPGEEAGFRRVMVLVKGNWAYGYLKSEIGVHRLVRISPFDSNARRHTSFAAVDVMPEITEDVDIDIEDKDIRIDTYRASGAGGQHVNKTSSAVRITHIPSGIVVQCQNERSQHKNRKQAMSLLKARLYRIKEQEREAELAKAYDEKGEIAWGNQIRSYVLQPYQLVKDLRTDEETSNVQAVLDGDIGAFLEAYLKHRIGSDSSKE